MNKTISICIPTYEMRGLGHEFLKQNLDILQLQTFKDFEVIVSDHSQDDVIENLCKKYTDSMTIKYIKYTNKYGNSSANLNNAIKNSSGKLIKIIFQDDFLYNKSSLEDILNNFDLEKDKWMVTACEHTTDGKKFFRPFYPKYNRLIKFGHNTISSPSVLTIKNEDQLLFDENLIWLMDCDYYFRCHRKFGAPKILNTINVVNRVGAHQVSNTIVNTMTKIKEFLYILKK